MRQPRLWPWQLRRLNFQPEFYMARYKDLREAKVDPHRHFMRHGYAEGRFPHLVTGKELEMDMWSGLEHLILPKLHALLTNNSPYERAFAGLALARWYGAKLEWHRSLDAVKVFFASPVGRHLVKHPAPDLLAIAASCAVGDRKLAQSFLRTAPPQLKAHSDFHLAALALADLEGDAAVERRLNEMWRKAGLSGVTLRPGDGSRIDRLSHNALVLPKSAGQPLVSVIVPVWNAGDTLGLALQSLIRQTYPALEILVCDDGSTDATPQVAQAYAEKDPRIRLLRSDDNEGAYPARNRGLAAATGDLLTVHDADDWSHPEKIARQVDSLRTTPSAVCCFCERARVTPNLVATRWRIDKKLTHQSLPSLMIRRAVLERLGYFDRVRASGDREYLLRIEACYGASAMVTTMPDVPLELAGVDPNSLTQAKPTHIRTVLRGARLDYAEAARAWHAGGGAFMEQHPKARPFHAPPVLRIDPPAPDRTDFERLVDSPLLDDIWYLETAPDIASYRIDARTHYLESGWRKGWDPGPGFSASGYALAHGVTEEPPLVHFERQGRAAGLAPLPRFQGTEPSGPTTALILCAPGPTEEDHDALHEELTEAARAGLCPVVVLPHLEDAARLQLLLPYCHAVEMLPFSDREARLPIAAATLAAMEALAARHDGVEWRCPTQAEAPRRIIAAHLEATGRDVSPAPQARGADGFLRWPRRRA